MQLMLTANKYGGTVAPCAYLFQTLKLATLERLVEKLTTEGPSGADPALRPPLTLLLRHSYPALSCAVRFALRTRHRCSCCLTLGADPMFLSLFLVVFRSFTTPGELFSQLVKRFDIQPPGELKTAEQIAVFKRTQMQVRVRVCNVFKNWLQNHFYDFDKVRGSRAPLTAFIGN